MINIEDFVKYENIVERNFFIPHEVEEKDKNNSYFNFGNFIPEQIFQEGTYSKKKKEKENDTLVYPKKKEKNINGNEDKTSSKEANKPNGHDNKSHSKEKENHKENLNIKISKESKIKISGVPKENNIKNSNDMKAETDKDNLIQINRDNQIENVQKNSLKDLKDKQIEIISRVKDNLEERKNKQTVTDSDNSVPNDLKFGQHKSESFYENYGREIIFQIFGYPKMSHFSFDYDVKKNNVIDKISKWGKESEKKDINLQSYLFEETGAEIIEKENTNKKEIKFLEDKKLEHKEKSNDNIFNLNSDDIKNSNSFYTDIKANGNESSDYDKSKERKNLTDKEIKKKTKKKNKNNDVVKFKGDFDFLIHGLDGKILKAVLEDKKKYPFIFFGNFELKENDKFDILGEIKETLHKSQDAQALKYIKMIYHILKKDHNNEFGQKLGFREEHIKVLMYVFNSEYYSFLLEMLSFDINLKKFKNNEEEKSECFINICNTFKGKREKNKLLKTIIRSDLPFIFIFVPNILKIQHIKEKEKCELSNKVITLEEQLQKQNQEINDLKSKFENKQKTIDDLKTKIENQKIESEKVMELKIREALKKYGIKIE